MPSIYFLLFCVTERLPPKKSDNHLKAGKNPRKESDTDKVNNNSRGNEIQLTVEPKKHIVEEEDKKQKNEMEMDMLISKLEDLKTQPLEIPEYKDAYKANLQFLFKPY